MHFLFKETLNQINYVTIHYLYIFDLLGQLLSLVLIFKSDNWPLFLFSKSKMSTEFRELLHQLTVSTSTSSR